MKTSTNKLNQAIERMSSGYKVNHAKDNAANYSISTNMSTKISAYEIAESNTMMGLDMVATASESLSLIEDKLMRLRALATQANNGTYGVQSLDAINTEANALTDEIERLYKTAEYNGVKLFNYKEQIDGYTEAMSSGFIKEVVRRDTSSMVTLESVDENIALTSGTYSISTATELEKLANMTNKGLIGKNTEFVLANDIDLSEYEYWIPIGSSNYGPSGWTGENFYGDFDGNGYVIKNLTIDASGNYQGLFGQAIGADIKNLGIENACMKNRTSSNGSQSGIIVGMYSQAKISNCYVKGEINTNAQCPGGLVGNLQPGTYIQDSYFDGNINGYGVGGLTGTLCGKITNSFFRGDLNTSNGGGITYYISGSPVLTDCHVELLNYSDNVKVFGGKSLPNSTSNLTLNNFSYIADKELQLEIDPATINITKNNVHFYNSKILSNTQLQVGINSNHNSQLNLQIKLDLFDLNLLRGIGNYNRDYTSTVDSILNIVSNKQTELGATQNRLESVLDEISTQYENLVSSRSTIRDADMAELSSTYVQQQILQDASATLMATSQNLRAESLLGLIQSIS